MSTCGQCGGAIMTPGLSYGYAGPVCMCSWRTPVTPMPQAQIDEALVLAIEADKREIERLRAELAASQARQKVLREQIELTTIGACSCGTKTPDARYHSTYCVYSRLVAILALPADDTALREMLVEAQEEMRERCVGALRELADRWRDVSFHDDADILENDGVEVLRALEVKP